MYKKILLIYILLIIVGSFSYTYGQEYIFRVMANTGANMFRLNNQASWKKVEKGVTLNSGYWVKIVDDAYLGLLHNTGKTTGLVDPGVFETVNIEKSIQNKKKGLGAKYTEFVMNNVTDPDILAQNDLVSRGSESTIKLFLPVDSRVFNSKLIINWEPESDESTYIITIKGIFDDVLFEDESTSDMYLLDLDIEKLKNESTFVIIVTLMENKDIHSLEYVIDRIPYTEAKKYREDLQPYENSTMSPLDHSILGSYFETNNLLIDASYHYQLAIQIAPKVQDFKNNYDEFILRNRLGN